MTHPNGLSLEAFACGEASTTVAGHVDECGACAAFVEELRGLLAAGPSATVADAAVARAMASMSRDGDGDRAGDARVEPGPRPTASGTVAKRRIWMIATSVITPLAAAAAILFLVRSTPNPGTNVPTGSSPPVSAGTALAAPDTILMGSMPPRTEPDTQFKGGAQIAVIRERGKEQARFSGAVRVRPGDRLRLEVALDREQAILGGVLADDGSYLELMPQGVRGPGTHFSERSAKIDTLPTRGTILIGSPDAVARARDTKVLDGVSTLRVEWDQP